MPLDKCISCRMLAVSTISCSCPYPLPTGPYPQSATRRHFKMSSIAILCIKPLEFGRYIVARSCKKVGPRSVRLMLTLTALQRHGQDVSKPARRHISSVRWQRRRLNTCTHWHIQVITGEAILWPLGLNFDTLDHAHNVSYAT